MGAIDFSLNEELLKKIAALLETEVFFETGTFKGDTLAMARSHVPRCLSVEMAESLYKHASERFTDDNRIELFLDDSPSVIRAHQEELANRNVLYWLDAHWCTNDQSAGAESQSPLLDELNAIGRLNDTSAVLIDDARLYAATPPPPHRYSDWPAFDEVLRALLALSDTHRMMVLNDVILFYPRRIEADIAEYASVNGVNWRHYARDARKYQRIRRVLNFWRRAKR
jgi:hypothetical protein